jgi:hypothetical protein
MNPNMFAKVILASEPNNGANRIVTMHLRYPRIIHSEIMTHRVLSRNARSSRAVPVETMLREVRNDPFVPWHWGKNQKGMQAGEDHNAPIELFRHDVGAYSVNREDAWLESRDHEADKAEAYMNAGYHKQIPNRLLEPFAWIDTLITSTSWANFLHLRDHKDAEPHFQDLAKLVGEALDNAEYDDLRPGQWHLPYVPHWERADIVLAMTGKTWDKDWELEDNIAMAKISAARCARISYKPFDGDASLEREIERYNGLVSSDRIHASPLEHQATPDDPEFGLGGGSMGGNLGPGWVQFRKTIPGEYVAD